jgi:hypothetical protein
LGDLFPCERVEGPVDEAVGADVVRVGGTEDVLEFNAAQRSRRRARAGQQDFHALVLGAVLARELPDDELGLVLTPMDWPISFTTAPEGSQTTTP